MKCRLLILSILLAFDTSLSYSQKAETKNETENTKTTEKPRRVYHTIRLATAKPKIDGVLDDMCWQAGEWASDFTQWTPNEGSKPSQPTFIKVLYDNQNIYVAIKAVDSLPNKIDRKMGMHDELCGDMSGICFDSYFDHRTSFEFDMTSAGQKIDAIMTNPTNADLDWNPVWYGKTGLQDSAWVVEMEIPLSQLRYSNKDEQVWGMHVWRWINRIQEESDWEVQSSTGPGMLYLYGELHGIKGLKNTRHIELKPYVSAKLNTFPKQPSNPFACKGWRKEVNAGLDAKIGISSNFTLDLTVNPDFGQVESDPSEMNLTAFETFYSEKRPFFIEGRTIFDYDLGNNSIFYSRRIGHAPLYTPPLSEGQYLKKPESTSILTAEKLSGKTAKGLSVGILHSLTATEYATVNTINGNRRYAAEPLTNYFVGRLQQDFNGSNTVLGGIFTSTNRKIEDAHLDFMNHNAFTGGLDLLHQWNDKEFYLKANLIGSTINGEPQAIIDLQRSSARYYQRLDARHLTLDSTQTSLSGFGAKVKIGKGSKGLWRYSTEFEYYSPGLDLNDIGFLQRADMMNQRNNLSYSANTSAAIFRKYSFAFAESNQWNTNVEYLSSKIQMSTYFEFLNKWSFAADVDYTSKALDTYLLRGGYAMKTPQQYGVVLNLKTDQTKKLSFYAGTRLALGAENSLKYSSVTSGLTLYPVNNLKIGIDARYEKNDNELQYIEKRSYNSTSRYLLGNIQQQSISLTFRVNYCITPELSIQYYGSPFASTGRFNNFKAVTTPKASAYKDRFSEVKPTSLDASNSYLFDENGDNKTDYTIDNPDFNFTQFRSNLVLKWEYKPGSQLYFVWSNERTGYDGGKYIPLKAATRDIWDATSNNIFMLKFNYWFTL